MAPLQRLAQRAAAALGAAVVSASLLLAPPPAAAGIVDDLAAAALSGGASSSTAAAAPGSGGGGGGGGVSIIRLPASDDPDVLAAQQTMVQAWQTVGEAFFDSSFGGANWTDELRRHMLAAYASRDGAAAYAEIAAMLADLKDPYTRLLPPDEYRDFVAASSGELEGVGMLIANEPVEGHLVRCCSSVCGVC